MPNKNFIYIAFVFFLVVFFPFLSGFSRNDGKNVLNLGDDITSIISDSVVFPIDSILADSSAIDSLVTNLPAIVDTLDIVDPSKKKSGLDATVSYESQDSIIFTGASIGLLFGKGKVTYEEISLEADFIRMNLDSSVVYAAGRIDSLGEKVGYPVFKDGGDSYDSETILYNFDTKKGYITNVVTQQGEGYITSSQTKKMEDGSFFMKDGKYTTCDDHDHPHYFINMTKAKVRPKDNVVTGPVYLVIEDVPLPIAFPFGFFPFTSKYSSGVIMPRYGDEMTRGFYLQDGGYYFALSDYADLALTGDIYTKGSWGLKATSTYAKRYKFRGSFNTKYLTTITGDKVAGDYQVRKDFGINWSHQQDAKANPNQSFSASVDFSTSGYNRNEISQMYNANNYTQNTKSSTLNYRRTFFDRKFTMNANVRASQRSADSIVDLSLPNLSFNTTTIYPFKRKNAFGTELWYEKISFSYQGTIDNRIQTKEDKLFKSSLTKDWTNGMRHSIPVQTSFTLFDNINITPSLNYEERWYGSRIERHWDPVHKTVARDTIFGFNRLYNYSFSVSAGTQIYGFFKPLPVFGDKVEMIRHTFRPSVGFSMNPDFGVKKYGYYKEYSYFDENNQLVTETYSPYDRSLYGAPGKGRSGSISFSVDNTLEMKVKSDSDSTGIKKVSLIDRLSLNTAYNLAADSMNWSNISASLAVKVTKRYNLNISANFDPYTYEVNEDRNGRLSPVRVNKTQWEKNRIPGRLTSMTFSIPAVILNNDTFKKKKDKKKEQQPASPDADPSEENEGASQSAEKPSSNQYGKVLDADGYVIWELPWNFNLNYNINLGQGPFNYDKKEFDLKWRQSLSFGGNIRFSKEWSLSFNSSYNFDLKEIGYSSCSISRDLHCWNMSAQFIPFGPARSYNFTIAVKSSMLQDLKWEQRSSYYNGMQWY